MAGAYAYFEKDTAIIGNDYIERRFSTKDNRLTTTEIINKRIDGGKSVEFNSFSAEFFVAFKNKRLFGYKTDFLSSNSLELDNVNVLKRRVEFVFKEYIYNGARIIFIVNVEIGDNDHYMHKYIEMMIDNPERQPLVTIDYIDGEHISIKNIEQKWTIGKIGKAFLSKYHSALGQPVYLNGLFFGTEFPLAENNIDETTLYCRYYSGKRFDKLNLNCGHTFKTWNTVVGATRDYDLRVMREDFLSYIRAISRKIKPRFQYNSWYDHMHDITNENIIKSFQEIENGLSKTMVPPLDSYVVDDGFVDWDADFWSFNSKFPNELYPAAETARKFSSNFGLWNGPRGGYSSKTPSFGRNMEKAGKGGYNKSSKDVCVSSKKYIKNITKYYLEQDRKFDINYWKLDGFLLSACPSKKHGHMTGGYNQMYQYTEMWEDWINIFRKLRITRESVGKDLWITQTSYCNASPWFLQWSDSLWIQNSGDIGFIDKTKKGEKLSSRDVDRVLTYRDNRYYDFSVTRNYQFPHEFIYNHDPIYGNTAKISMTDEEFRKYMLMMATRGTAFWELYYSYNMFNKAKWRINADVLRFIRNDYEILKTSQFIGGCPEKAEVYGYSCWNNGRGIISIRNPGNTAQSFTVTFDEKIGVDKTCLNMKSVFVYPYDKPMSDKTYSYGDALTVNLKPLEAVIMKFSSAEEKVPSLVYSRFDSEKDLLLFFDDRIYVDESLVSANVSIEKIEVLEDYSTLKITFRERAESVSVSLTVKNAFGQASDVELNGKSYEGFVCKDNLIPSVRDFTVQCVINYEADGSVLSIGDVINVSCCDDLAVLRVGDKTSKSDLTLQNGEKVTVLCEPNGLVKLYINKKLACSVYNIEKCNELQNAEVTINENATDLTVLSKALDYSNI